MADSVWSNIVELIAKNPLVSVGFTVCSGLTYADGNSKWCEEEATEAIKG